METVAQSGSRADDDRAVHARLLAGDSVAPSDLVAAHLGPLVTWLLEQFPSLDPHALQTVATDLLLDLAERPERYDPARASLPTYLRMAARRDVQNLLRSVRRRAAREISLEAVELSAPAGNRWAEDAADPAETVVARESLGPALLARLRPSFSDREWDVALLKIDGERRTAVYAQVLGLSDRPRAEQEREVKRVKDRVEKRLRRLGLRLRDDA